MLYNVWQINTALELYSPYAAGTFVQQVFAGTPAAAVAIVASSTGISASVLQATPVVMSAFQWHP